MPLGRVAENLRDIERSLERDADPEHIALGIAFDPVRLETTAQAYRKVQPEYRRALLSGNRDYTWGKWAAILNDFGMALTGLGCLTRDTKNLLAAELVFLLALKIRTRKKMPVQWAATHVNLGIALLQLGRREGDAARLREGELAFRAASEVFTREYAPARWASIHNNLGNVLRYRGQLAGEASLLQEARQAYLSALEVRSFDSSPTDWAVTQNNLGITLLKLGDLTSDSEFYEKAREAFRSALDGCQRSRAPVDWAMIQNNLGRALRRESNPGSTSSSTRNGTLLDEAEIALRSALQERTQRLWPMHWAETQIQLAGVLARIGDLNSDAHRLREAEKSYRASIAHLTGAHVGWWRRWIDRPKTAVNRALAPIAVSDIQSGRAFALRRLGELTRDPATLKEAERAYREALSGYEASDYEDARQETAGQLALLLVALGRYDEAAEVIVPTLERSDAAIMDAARSPDGRARAVELVGHLYSLLSLCRLRQRTKDLESALIAAESGRARLLADALALDTLRREGINNPDVGAEIDAAWERRAALRMQLGYDRIGKDVLPWPLAPDERARLRSELQQARDAYLSLCRQHGMILTPKPLSLVQILAAAPDGGALVIPVLTDAESFAFVLDSDSDTVSLIDLPKLNLRAVTDHLYGEGGWLGVYNERFRKHGKDAAGAAARAAADTRWHSRLTATRAWLWERLLAPLHAHLCNVVQLTANAPVVLMSPGLLSILPLHAAGPGPGGRNFGDHWTVSYAPSVRALLTCQQKARDAKTRFPKLLAVIDPPTDNPKNDLLGARQEAPMLAERFAGAKQVILWREQATLAAVLADLPEATHFHASTHGWHDPLQPLKSGLHLADAPLLLEMLQEARLAAARLIFLSACESGRAGIRRLAEEFIGMPAGFVQGGAACVIAALWPIRDDAAFLLASRFYALYLDDQGRERTSPVTALREAVSWLRKLTYGDLRQVFPVCQGSSGPEILLLHQAMKFDSADEGIPMPLGPDKECPYADAEHWAAFTVTGA
jgi:CHAT domain-containing protein/tetratricopeptide (TPR) repeat protein